MESKEENYKYSGCQTLIKVLAIKIIPFSGILGKTGDVLPIIMVRRCPYVLRWKKYLCYCIIIKFTLELCVQSASFFRFTTCGNLHPFQISDLSLPFSSWVNNFPFEQ